MFLCVWGPRAGSIASVEILCLSEAVQAQFCRWRATICICLGWETTPPLLLSTMASMADSESEVSQLGSSDDESSGKSGTAAPSGKKSSRGKKSSQARTSKSSKKRKQDGAMLEGDKDCDDCGVNSAGMDPLQELAKQRNPTLQLFAVRWGRTRKEVKGKTYTIGRECYDCRRTKRARTRWRKMKTNNSGMHWQTRMRPLRKMISSEIVQSQPWRSMTNAQWEVLLPN